jgi:ABC-type multidrug transport system ATPase subunit
LDEVAQLCDRVVLVSGGRIIDERLMDEGLRAGIGSPLEDYFLDTIAKDAIARDVARKDAASGKGTVAA